MVLKVGREAGWRLLVGLLPNQYQISMPTPRPSWRDWALAWSSGVTNAAYWHQVDACARLLVEQLGDDVERWKALIEQFENLPGPVQTEFLERLSGFAEKTLDEETRRVVSDALREKVSLHRKFADADWTLAGGDPRGTGEGSESLRAGRPGTEERLVVWAALAGSRNARRPRGAYRGSSPIRSPG